MLLREDGDAVVCIGQASHAWLSGQLARAWADVEPREEVCLAAEQHDVVMAPWPFPDRAALELRCEGRRLEGRYDDERSLHAALERAPRVDLHVTLHR